jgi:hypothetical protein
MNLEFESFQIPAPPAPGTLFKDKGAYEGND